MAAPIISCQKVSYAYGEDETLVQALRDVTCDIQRGEFVAIIGPNGSGKSTLAKHFNALLLPTEGTVTIAGYDTQDEGKLWQVRQTVGMVFQNPDNQLVATIVEEDVAFGPENLGVPSEEIRRRVDEALSSVNMLEYKSHAPHLLSGGQKQRVAIAGVLAMRPMAIVLDEPTAMLDPVGRKEVIGTVHQLNKQEGITVVLITHHMNEAVNADRIIVMDEGEIVLEGTPREVFMQTQRLIEIGMDVPQVTSLAVSLSSAGVSVKRDILTVDEMVDALCLSK